MKSTLKTLVYINLEEIHISVTHITNESDYNTGSETFQSRDITCIIYI